MSIAETSGSDKRAEREDEGRDDGYGPKIVERWNIFAFLLFQANWKILETWCFDPLVSQRTISNFSKIPTQGVIQCSSSKGQPMENSPSLWTHHVSLSCLLLLYAHQSSFFVVDIYFELFISVINMKENPWKSKQIFVFKWVVFSFLGCFTLRCKIIATIICSSTFVHGDWLIPVKLHICSLRTIDTHCRS